MEIVLKRRLTNELLTTYLPSLLLLGITFATTFFKEAINEITKLWTLSQILMPPKLVLISNRNLN